jgi:hypothetical protein
MKSYLLLVACALVTASLQAQETAHVSLWCNSLRFPPATTGTETLSLTTDSTFSEITDELSPVSDPSLPGYGALFVLDDPSSAGSITGEIFFNPPPFADANNDGFDDFLEVSQAVGPATTQGVFNTVVDSGTVTANWSRAAGSSTGSCTVQMTGKTFGQLPAFTFTFEVLTYLGTYTYTPTTNSITGLLSLTNIESASNILSGPLTLIRVAGTNRFNALTLLPGTLTNSAGQTLTYTNESILRDTQRLTNYYGYFDFADGDLSTSTPDYIDWTLSIDDTNDANANGIPDLSDDLSSAPPPAQPSLALTRNSNQLLFQVGGAIGTPYTLQSITALGQTNWQAAASLTLTNNPQPLAIPIPAAPTEFWRLRSP